MRLSKVEELVSLFDLNIKNPSKVSSEKREDGTDVALCSFSGVERQRHICPSNYEQHTNICDSTPRKRAVVVVIDEFSKKSQAPDPDWPVVVVCGINYGQQVSTNYCSQSIGLFDHTKMRSNLGKAFQLAFSNKSCLCRSRLRKPANFHLVAINLFPWITQQAWSKYNFDMIDEALMIGCLGFNRPFALLERISKALTDSDWLVFHGSKNSVAPFGMSFLLQQKERAFNVMFSRNLAFNLGKAVILCPSLHNPEL